jgi:heme oxygenase
MSLLQIARDASEDLHRQIEQTALAAALAKGTVERTVYARLMLAMASVHRVVESQLEVSPFAILKGPSFHREQTARNDAHRIAADLEDETFAEVLLWRSALENHEPTSPWGWVGALYVLEGSKMGSRMLIAPIAKALGVPAEAGCGLDYHLAALADRGQSWTSFKGFLESANANELDKLAFADGVRLTFKMMCNLYSELSERSALLSVA